MSSITSWEAVFFIIGGIVCAIGLIGNTPSLAVLHKSTADNVGTYLIEAHPIPSQITTVCVNNIVQRFRQMDGQYYVDCMDDSYCRRQSLHRSVSPHGRAPALHEVQRYIAVCRPMDAPRLCTKYNVTSQCVAPWTRPGSARSTTFHLKS